MTGKIIVIEGIIGAGKSTLATTIGEALDLPVMQEPVESNPYLDHFYKDPKRYAFEMQMHMLFRRHAQQREASWRCANGAKGVILDRSLPGDRVFCKLHHDAGNIGDLAFGTYQMAYDIMTTDMLPPRLMLFLDVPPADALKRVQHRGRAEEVSTPAFAPVETHGNGEVRDGFETVVSTEADRAEFVFARRVRSASFQTPPTPDFADRRGRPLTDEEFEEGVAILSDRILKNSDGGEFKGEFKRTGNEAAWITDEGGLPEMSSFVCVGCGRRVDLLQSDQLCTPCHFNAVVIQGERERLSPPPQTVDLAYLKKLDDGYQELLNHIARGNAHWSRGMKVQRISWGDGRLHPANQLVPPWQDGSRLQHVIDHVAQELKL